MSLPTQYNGKNQPPVGALANALGRLQASRPLRELRETVKGVTKQLPEAIQEATSKIDEYARGMISGSGSTLFEELGLYYIGPIDGHNLDNLVAVLQGAPPLLSFHVSHNAAMCSLSVLKLYWSGAAVERSCGLVAFLAADNRNGCQRNRLSVGCRLMMSGPAKRSCRGCVDGAEVKSTETVGPVLVHIVTEKGRGYLPAETASDKMHGVGKYDPITGEQQKSKGGVSPFHPACSPFECAE